MSDYGVTHTADLTADSSGISQFTKDLQRVMAEIHTHHDFIQTQKHRRNTVGNC